MPENLTVVITAKRNGTADPLEDLVDTRISLSLLETSSAVFRFADPTMSKLDSNTWNIGDAIEVSAQVGATVTKVFEGEVVALGADQRDDSRHEFVVEAMDHSHRLSGALTPKTYLKQKYSDVATTIANAHGLTAKCTSTSMQHDYLLQTVSDRAYLTFMADDIGYEWFVDAKQLVFRPRPGPGTVAATLKWSTNLTRFEARASAADVATSITVRGWNALKTEGISGQTSAATSDPTMIGSTAPLATTVLGKAKAFAKPVNLVPVGLQDAEEATIRSKAIAADVQGSMMRATGEADATPALRPGVWVDVEECGVSLSGKYYVTDCEHVFGVRQTFRTRFKMSGRHASGIVGRGEQQPRAFGQVGLVIGIVTNIKDTVGATQRVRVKFPAMPDLESAWARVVTLGAGGGRGGFDMRPEVNDEVLVGFEQGDLRRPFVIGGLLGKADKDVLAAVDGNGKVANRGIRTRTGNTFVMSDGDDAQGKRHITFTTADAKSSVRLGEDKVTIKSDAAVPIELVSGEASIKIDNGAITIKAKSVEIKTQQGIKLDGLTIDLKATTAIGIDGGAKLDAKGTMVQIAADGMAALKGAIVKLN
ncbi:MAG: phage baseplate assembly protein V [Ilumatobacteraceae bacterium]